MTLPLYLASPQLPGGNSLPGAYMACHFSPEEPGLMHIPAALPEGTVIMANDLFSPRQTEPEQVREQLCALAVQCRAPALILDFQRPENPLTGSVTALLAKQFPCPVFAAPAYARELSCGVFLPAPPLHIPLSAYLSSWAGRSVWLEAFPDCEILTLTFSGCTATAGDFSVSLPFEDRELFCSYRTETEKDCARFFLRRSPEQVLAMLSAAAELGVKGAVGMLWEMEETVKKMSPNS